MKSKRLFVWTIVLIVISFGFTTLVSVNSINTVIEGNNEQLSKVLTSKIYDAINNRLTEPIAVAQTMSNDYFLIEPLTQDDFPDADMEPVLVSYLAKLSSSMDYSSAFVVSEKSRTYYTQDGFNKIVSPETDEHDVWYSNFVDSGKKYDFDVDTDEAHGNAWTVFVNARIEDDNGNLLGACGVSVVMTDLQDILNEYEADYNVKINLVNSDGLVQVDTDLINIENAVLDIQITDTADNEDYVYDAREDGSYIVSKYVENLGWYLVVQSDGTDSTKVYSDLIYKDVLFFIVVLVILLVMVSSNITIEKKRMEEHAREIEQYAKEQEVLKAEAETASKAKGDFLANMSHEIRTPINAVLGMDEMILRESSEDQIVEYASDIKRAGNTLLSLINDILDFSKIESGRMDIIPVDYDFKTLINDVVSLIRIKAQEKNLTLTLSVDPDTPEHLHGDEVRLRQILTNILSNAVKYTPEGSVTLTISGKMIAARLARIYVSVKDTGIGIRPEDKEKLFDSFQRVEESRNRSIEGTGLGLSITNRLLKLMGSTLEVNSTYGEGSDFYFYLDQEMTDNRTIGSLDEADSTCGSREDGKRSALKAPGTKVLVVDDNTMNRKVFKGLLKNTGMEIDEADSGRACLERIREKAYDMIFLDYLMPEMDGIETLQQAKALDGNLSRGAVVIALTANALSGAKEMFLEKGFCDFLSKPIMWEELEEMFVRYLPDRCSFVQQETAPEQPKTPQQQTLQPQNPQQEGSLVDWERGLKYCMDNPDFYREMLRLFLDGHAQDLLQELYEQGSWEDYRIKIHAMKTNLANIGAEHTSELAKSIELALKHENDISFAQENHEGFLAEYQIVVSEVEKYLAS